MVGGHHMVAAALDKVYFTNQNLLKLNFFSQIPSPIKMSACSDKFCIRETLNLSTDADSTAIHY